MDLTTLSAVPVRAARRELARLLAAAPRPNGSMPRSCRYTGHASIQVRTPMAAVLSGRLRYLLSSARNYVVMRGLRLPWAAITKPPTSNPASPGSAGFGSAVRGSRAPAGVGGDCMPGYRGKHRAKRALYATGRSIDDRFGAAKWGEKALKKAFPDHWSFFLGEIALYSFIILVLTGTFLAFFYVPDQHVITYHGPYGPLSGQKVSIAYRSVLRLSFEVRAGLVFRQIHHWAALVM